MSWWGTASGRPQRSILTKLCLCTLPSTTHWTLLKSWLVSASPCTLCYLPSPDTFPRRQNLAPDEGLHWKRKACKHEQTIEQTEFCSLPRAKCELAQILLSRFFMACKNPGPRAKWTLHDFCTGDKNRCANTVFCSRLCSRASKPGQACVIKSTSRNQNLLITCTLLTPRRRRRRLAPLPRPRQEQRPRQESLIVQNNATASAHRCPHSSQGCRLGARSGQRFERLPTCKPR